MPNQFFSPEGDLENYFVSEYWLIDQWIGDELWGWGQNINRQLGINAINPRSTPVTTLAGGTNWKQVACGSNHTAAVKTDGTLWIWGGNSDGQLGTNDTNVRSTPVTTFAGGNNWKQVSCGHVNTAVIKNDGTLWTWGRNLTGQLGNNAPTGQRNTPITTFAGGTNWNQVSCGYQHMAAIKTDGTLWVWGNNDDGQLGNTGILIDANTPITTFAGGTNWKQVSCGGFHTSAVKTDGTLWVWGRNSYSESGTNTSTRKDTPVTTFAGGTNWKQVECGYAYVTAIKTDGTLWGWGSNGGGELATFQTTRKSTPVTTFAGGTNWKQVSAGRNSTAAIKTDGSLWVWGNNTYRQLGNNSTTNFFSTPITTFAGGTNWKQVFCANGGHHTLAVTSGLIADLPIS